MLPAKQAHDRVAFAKSRLGRVFDLALTLQPSIRGDEHMVVLGDDEIVRGKGRLVGHRFDDRAPRIGSTVSFLNLDELLAHELPARFLILQEFSGSRSRAFCARRAPSGP